MYRFVFLFFLRHAYCETSSADLQSTLKEVTEGLNSLMDQKDAMRKIAIRGLMRSVSTVEEINETTNATLLNVTVLLEQIKTNMATQVTADSQYVTDHVDYMNNCDDRLVTELENSRLASAASVAAHHACRLNHNTSYHEHLNAHAALLNFEVTTVHGTSLGAGGQGLTDACATPAPVQDQVAAWEQHHADAETWFGNARAIFTPLANDDIATEAWEANNRSDCNGFQMRHETAVCGYIATHIATCTTRHACWVGVHGINASSDSVIMQYSTDNTNIPRLVRLIDYVICLVQQMRLDLSSTARATCADILTRSIDYDGPYATYHTFIPLVWPQPAQCVTAFNTGVANYHPFLAYYQGTLGNDEVTNLLNPIATCATSTMPPDTVTFFSTYGVATPNPVPTLPNGPVK